MTADVKTRRDRVPFWLTAIFVVVGTPITIAVAVYEYVTATVTPLHPNAKDVPSNTRSTPAAPWMEAVEKSRQLLRKTLVDENLPGVSVAVGVHGDIVWAEGFGFANIEYRMPVTPETKFRIGTASIALTSAGAGLLLEKGALNLDEKIQTYVPEFPQKQWPVTLHQLMGHTAGVRNDGGDEGPLFGVRCAKPVDALPHFAEMKLRFEPGTSFRHSSYGWILVSAAIESASKEPFLSFMKTRIFEPLGMNDTMPESDTEAIPNKATPYFPRYGGDPKYGPDPMRDLNLSCYSGSSVFISTPSDLVRFAMAIENGKLLKPETVTLMQKTQVLPSGVETGYGLGWDLETVAMAGRDTKIVGHDGDLLGGMTSSLMVFPEYGLVVAVVSNTSYADTFGIGVKVAEIFAGSRALR